MHTFVVGAGFSGLHIAKRAQSLGGVCGTRRSESALIELQQAGIDSVVLCGLEPAVTGSTDRQTLDERTLHQLALVTHLVICAGPARHAPLNDPVLRLFSMASIRLPKLQWVGYLSTIGVYGNHDGAWVDESTACTSVQERSIMRREAELGWQAQAQRWQVPLAILRLSGIYGPGRNAVEDAIAGRARMLIKEGQVFNRIHVSDLAEATMKAASIHFNGIVNVTDDLPAAPQEVIRYAHQLAGKPEPEAVDFATSEISDMARSFYSENKRVSNALSKQQVGMVYNYPTYREGLDALWHARGNRL